MILLLFRDFQNPDDAGLSLAIKAKRMDIDGVGIFLVAIITLILTLEWGGIKYPWDSYQVLVQLVLAGVSLLSFVGWQTWRGDSAVLPPSILKNRSVTFAALFSFCNAAALYLMAFYVRGRQFHAPVQMLIPYHSYPSGSKPSFCFRCSVRDHRLTGFWCE